MEGKRPEARYASAACRTRDWKRRKERAAGDAPETSQNGKPRALEYRLSLRKAQRLADTMCSPGTAREIQAVLEAALPPRQRAAAAAAGVLRRA
jgi:hypothetical protein